MSKEGALPDSMHLPRWARITGQVFMASAYLLLALAGLLGMTWPPGVDLLGWAFWVTRASGFMALVASLLAAYAVIRRRWLLELDVLWAVGLGLTGYATVLMLYVGPQREWLLMTALIGTLLCGLAGRGVRLITRVELRLTARRRAREGV